MMEKRSAEELVVLRHAGEDDTWRELGHKRNWLAQPVPQQSEVVK